MVRGRSQNGVWWPWKRGKKIQVMVAYFKNCLAEQSNKTAELIFKTLSYNNCQLGI
jgi:hypothetical protein